MLNLRSRQSISGESLSLSVNDEISLGCMVWCNLLILVSYKFQFSDSRYSEDVGRTRSSCNMIHSKNSKKSVTNTMYGF